MSRYDTLVDPLPPLCVIWWQFRTHTHRRPMCVTYYLNDVTSRRMNSTYELMLSRTLKAVIIVSQGHNFTPIFHADDYTHAHTHSLSFSLFHTHIHTHKHIYLNVARTMLTSTKKYTRTRSHSLTHYKHLGKTKFLLISRHRPGDFEISLKISKTPLLNNRRHDFAVERPYLPIWIKQKFLVRYYMRKVLLIFVKLSTAATTFIRVTTSISVTTL